ncbi:MAG: hypothetical protein JW768_15005 [Chitinispirillaceae bacterium]|nr:hypothetical protein [Chitinispirillaceae bacterium]
MTCILKRRDEGNKWAGDQPMLLSWMGVNNVRYEERRSRRRPFSSKIRRLKESIVAGGSAAKGCSNVQW